jgi:hypothetical protein
MQDAVTCAELRSIGTNKLDSVSKCGMTLLVVVCIVVVVVCIVVRVVFTVRPHPPAGGQTDRFCKAILWHIIAKRGIILIFYIQKQ